MGSEWKSDLAIQDGVEVQIVRSPDENLQATILQEEHKDKFGKKDVHILFTGLSGAGKSTLVNAMLGEVVAQTGCGPDSVEASKSQYYGKIEGVKLQVYDTNGFSIKSNHRIPKTGSFDLILICIKITNRVGDSEMNLLQALGKALNKEAWKRTVIVLTFANLLLQDPKIDHLKEEAKRQAMNNIMEEYKESITKHLEGYMDKETAHNIPFCLVGLSDPFDPKERSVRKLPTTEDWLIDLWEICANRVNPEIKSWFQRLMDKILELFSKIRTIERKQQKQHEEKIELK